MIDIGISEKDFVDILKVTQSINTLYNIIEEPRINQIKKEQYIEYLKIALEVENSIYKRLELTYIKVYKLLKFLKEFDLFGENVSNVQNYVLDPVCSRMDGRIVNQLQSHLRNLNKQNESQHRNCRYQNNINKIFLVALAKKISSTPNSNSCKGLLNAIYNLSFVDSEIEQILVNCKFNLDFLVISDSVCHPNFISKKDQFYNSKKSKNIIKRYINKLMDCPTNQEDNINLELRRLYIETHLSFLNSKMIQEVDSNLCKFIEKETISDTNNQLIKEYIGYIRQYKRIIF